MCHNKNHILYIVIDEINFVISSIAHCTNTLVFIVAYVTLKCHFNVIDPKSTAHIIVQL
jgi:hypothetical protein